MGLEKALEKLSSGKRINRAADDAAGMAISNKLDAQIRGLEQANRNANDGISLIQTAEGALNEVQSMVQRMRELAVQASNGTLAPEDRDAIQKEINQLTEEVLRVSNEVEFNEMTLLNGDLDRVNFSNDDTKAKLFSITDDVPSGTYELQLEVPPTVPTLVSGFPAGSTATIEAGNMVRVKGPDGFNMLVEAPGMPSAAPPVDVKIDILDVGPLSIHIGANEGQNMEVRIPNMSPKALGIEDLDMSSSTTSNEALGKIDDAINTISLVRAQLGAYQNRLEYTENNLTTATENMTASLSRIVDVDMAVEMANYTQLNVISQSGVSMIAQANQRPEQVLQLLRG